MKQLCFLPSTHSPHITGSVVVSEPAQECPYAELYGRKVRADRAMGYGKLEVLGSKLKAKLHSRDRRGINGEFHVRSERFSHGLGRRTGPVAVFVYSWRRVPGLWSMMASLEPCFLQDRPRGMVSGVEEREVFGLGSPQGWQLRGLWSWKPDTVFSKEQGKYL